MLEKRWTCVRGKGMKGAPTLFAQDAESMLSLYTPADTCRGEADEQVTDFLAFRHKVWRGSLPTFVFDSRFTSYEKLSELNAAGIELITLRRRGAALLRQVEKLEGWQRIHVSHAKRKYPNPHQPSACRTTTARYASSSLAATTTRSRPSSSATTARPSPPARSTSCSPAGRRNDPSC